MHWSYLVAYFFGGLLLTNAIPHLVSGLMGRAFQSPFAQPSGRGLSSSTVNVLWGWFNLAAGYALIFHIGAFDLRAWSDVLPAAVGGVLISVFSARHFGQFHGGNHNNNAPH